MARIGGSRNRRQQPRMGSLVAGLFIAALVVTGILYAVHFLDDSNTQDIMNAGVVLMSDPQGKPMTMYNGKWYTKKEGIVTTLLMGVDKNADFEQNLLAGNSEQADLLLLIVADTINETYTIVHINRDTMTDITLIGSKGTRIGSYVAQIALSYNYGMTTHANSLNTVEAVSKLFRNVKIDHFMSLSMDGMIILNDAVGGVTLEVMDDFTGIDDTLVQGETVTLLGEHALLYVRERKNMDDNTNLHRMVRQQQYMTAFQDQFKTLARKDSDFVTNTLLKVNEYMVSDCTIDQLSELINNMTEFDMSEGRTLEGEAIRGKRYIEYYPNNEALRQMVMELFYEPV